MSGKKTPLGALLGGEICLDTAAAAISGRETAQEIDIALVRPNRYQPRREFAEDALRELAASVRVYGVLQPVLVRRVGKDGYELIAGERRWRAAQEAGLKKVPAIVCEYNDAVMSEVALVENIQREDLNIIEEAMAYERLMTEFKLTQEQMAQKIGRSRSHIANILRLLKLSPQVKSLLAKGKLTMGQAKPLLSLAEDLQNQAAQVIAEKNLTARQVEALVKKLQKNADKPPKPKKDSVYFRDVEDRLTRFFGAKVKISNGAKKNSLRIDFYSEDELMGLVDILTDAFEERNVPASANRRIKEFTV